MEKLCDVLMIFVAVSFGSVLALGFSEASLKQSVRAGVMVIDGTAYVLVPAKRGVE